MTDWATIIPDPEVPFGGAKKRIEAIRITANLAEIIEPKTRHNLIKIASARLGISRRKVEEEYLPDLEARAILVFNGNIYTIHTDPTPYQFVLEEQDDLTRLESNPEAKEYIKAKARMKKEQDQITDPPTDNDLAKKIQHEKYRFYAQDCEAHGEEPDSYDKWLTQFESSKRDSKK